MPKVGEAGREPGREAGGVVAGLCIRDDHEAWVVPEVEASMPALATRS
jgi:hypothetical protein